MWPLTTEEYCDYERAVVGSLGTDLSSEGVDETKACDRHKAFLCKYTSNTAAGPSDPADAKEALLLVLSTISDTMLMHYNKLISKKKIEPKERTEYISASELLADMGLVNTKAEHRSSLLDCIMSACSTEALDGKPGWRRNEAGELHIPRSSLDASRRAVYYACYKMCQAGCEESLKNHVDAPCFSDSYDHGSGGFGEDLDGRIRIGDVLEEIEDANIDKMTDLDPDKEDKVKMHAGRMMSKLEKRRGKKRERDEEGTRIYTGADRAAIRKCLISSLVSVGVHVK